MRDQPRLLRGLAADFPGRHTRATGSDVFGHRNSDGWSLRWSGRLTGGRSLRSGAWERKHASARPESSWTP